MNYFKVDFVTYQGIYETVETNRLNVPTAEGRRCILANHMPIMLPLTIGVVETTYENKDSYHSISNGCFCLKIIKALFCATQLKMFKNLMKEKLEHQFKRLKKDYL